MEKPVAYEIASVRSDPFSPTFAGLLHHNDDTLTTRGQGKGIKLYEELERDGKVFAALNKRKMAVIARPWEVKPASKKREDVLAADIVREQLVGLNFDDLCLALLDAINKGFSVGEIIWEVSANQIVANRVIPRDQRRFLFGENYELRLATLQNILPGEEMPAKKFIVHSLGAKDGNPYGHGLGSRLFWLVWFKRQGMGFWMTFLDKFGSPTVVGKYPLSDTAGKTALISALDAVSQDAGIAIPDNMTVELLEAARGGNGSYEAMCRYMDEQIADCILGDAEGSQGSGGAVASAALTRNEVRLELVRFDADMLSATLNKTLVKWISEFNVPNATPPTVWRKVIQSVSAEDMKKVAEKDAILDSLGLEPDEVYIRETYGEGWKRKAVVKPADFAEGNAGGMTTDEALTKQLSIQSAPAWNAILDKIREVVDHADSLNGLKDDLVANFGDYPSDELVKVMATGFALAELMGISEVMDHHAH